MPTDREAGDGTAGADTAPTGGASDRDTAATRVSVPGRNCAACVDPVIEALTDHAGIQEVTNQPATGEVLVRYDQSVVTDSDIATIVTHASADTTAPEATDPADEPTQLLARTEIVKTILSGLLVALGLLVEFVFPGANSQVIAVSGSEIHIADTLFIGAIALGGRHILTDGYHSARSRALDMDVLMATAILGAITASLIFGESLYFEAATLVVLFTVAELLEDAAMKRARQSLQELVSLAPETATVKRDGTETTVPVDEVAVGDTIVVRPGEKIPLDGTVITGDSAVNQAAITGESVPVNKAAGDEVYAGTLNTDGYLEVETTATASDTTLSQIIEMVADAQSAKTDREQFVERFAGYYTPVVVLFAICVTLASPVLLGTGWATAVVYGLTLLVLACPCAFVISTPVSVVSGITSAAKNGVLIKGGPHLEAMGAVDVVAFDKTGTLTTGELSVTDVIPFNEHTPETVLRRAGAIEQRSDHPISEAIVAEADTLDLSDQQVTDFESLTGKGVTATLDGTSYYVGKPGLFEDQGHDLSHVHLATDGGVTSAGGTQQCQHAPCRDLLAETIPELQAAGKTVVLVGTADELLGIIAVADELRPGATRVIERLHELGVKQTVMLTGDNRRTARAIAQQAGIDTYHAELLPEDKVTTVETLTEQYDGVAMVGDGVNDAPALATATVGIAMGAAGTDTAIETADIALMNDDLAKLPYLYTLAHTANSVIRQNIAASLGVKAILAIGVPFGYVPIWLAVLAGDAGMTTAVTGNAMRLSRVRPDTAPTEE